MAGHEWVNHEWLVDTILWIFHQNQWWWIIILFFTAIAATPLIYFISKSKSYLEIWTYTFFAIAIIPYIGVRPQIISLFLFFIIHQLLLKYFNNPKSKIVPFLIPLLFLMWANLHAGFASGLALFFIMGIGYYFSPNKKIPLQKTIIIFITSCLATLINPYSYHLYQEIIRVALSPETARYIVEWQPPLNQLGIIVPILLGISIFTVFKYFKKVPLIYSLSVIFFLFSYLKSTRMAPMLVIVLVAFFQQSVTLFFDNLKVINKTKPYPNSKKKIISTVSYLLFIVLFSGLYYMTVYSPNITYPANAINYLNSIEQTESIGNLYHPYNWGGYIIQHSPDTKTFIDGRMPHWQDENGNSAMQDYIKINQTDKYSDWHQIFEKYNIQSALIPNVDQQIMAHQNFEEKLNNPVLYNLISTYISSEPKSMKGELVEKGWEVVYEDQVATVLIK